MKLHTLYERSEQTPAVTFKYLDDVEGDKNRGFRVDEIKALVDGKEAGYLKVSYIPKDRFAAHYQNIFQWLSKMRGHSIFPYKYRETCDWKKIPIDVLKQNLQHVHLVLDGGWNMEEFDRLRSLNDDEVIKEYERFEQLANKKYAKEFKEFKQYFVDKAYVDFIRVEKEFQRRGIGTALQRAGYEWMKKKKIPLYASATQTDEAKALWAKMKTQFKTAEDKFKLHGKKFTRTRFAESI